VLKKNLWMQTEEGGCKRIGKNGGGYNVSNSSFVECSICDVAGNLRLNTSTSKGCVKKVIAD